MTWKSDWHNCKKILCIRPDNVGDVILMTPVFRALKESISEVHITLLTSSVGKPITPFIPDIYETLIYDAPWIENDKIKTSASKITNVVKQLKKKKFDGAIILTNFSQNPLPIAMITYLASIPKVLSYAREFPNELITYWVPDGEPFVFPIHGVERQLKLLSHIGVSTTNDALTVKIQERTALRLENKLETIGIDLNKPFLIIHPGASLERRRYPEIYFVQAAKLLRDKLGYQILLTGSGIEQIVTKNMQKDIGQNAYSLADKINLEEFIALIGLADVLISNNTAPVHIASAVGTPVVDLYARSNPEHTPWKIKNRVLYFDIPLEKRTKNTVLLSLIPKTVNIMPQPEHIVQAVKELLSNSEESSLPKSLTSWYQEAKTPSTNPPTKKVISKMYPLNI